MTEQEKWEYINGLDEELLKGAAMLSEWTIYLARDAESAFCSGAHLSCILACQAAIESHLRYEVNDLRESKGWSFYQLIEMSRLSGELRSELHDLRKFRNKWVHVGDPSDDQDLIDRAEYHEFELLEKSKSSIRTMLRVIYDSQLI